MPDLQSKRRSAIDVAAIAEEACLLEATAPKPGNVSPGRPFEDLRHEDFVASAHAIRPVFEHAGARPIGETVRLAVEATLGRAPSNTNLGIVLLLAPLARAAVIGVGGHFSRTAIDDCPPKMTSDPITDLQSATREVLGETTIDDARQVYAAIRLANPGGLGTVDSQDVASEPTMTLVEVMRLAAHYDSIASEYATGFDLTFTIGAPALERARHDGLNWDDAIVETFLTLLARAPDTHIVRRTGIAAADEVSQRARDVLEKGGVRSLKGHRAIDDMDRALRDPWHGLNPGTTADLTTAAIFVELVRRHA